ncbi:MAG: NAD(P)H-dependent oxidoreductase [Gammaproteobacteria bacterium]|nr:NAD(P)H-dependent oxidoreductase [Gammaproteobacteria bacterium]
MRVLAISGSLRSDSSNSLLLKAIQRCAPEAMDIAIYQRLESLPIFNPDLEGSLTPTEVELFCSEIEKADGIIIASPEYVRAIPGGLKNAIDWLVSRPEIMSMPIVLAHSSYRGDDMLASLRIVLHTVSDRFDEDNFLRIALNSTSPVSVDALLSDPANRSSIVKFLSRFERHIG